MRRFVTCTLQHIIRVIKSRRMRWAGNVARMGDMRYAYKALEENLKERGHWEDLAVDGKVTLEWFLGK
jgi:hypothetical protein